MDDVLNYFRVKGEKGWHKWSDHECRSRESAGKAWFNYYIHSMSGHERLRFLQSLDIKPGNDMVLEWIPYEKYKQTPIRIRYVDWKVPSYEELGAEEILREDVAQR